MSSSRRVNIILSKEDFRIFLEADKKSLGVSSSRFLYMRNEIYVFQKRLRKVELAINTQKGIFRRLIAQYMFKRIAIRLGFSIPPNTFGPGLSIAHRGTIVVNGHARIGANCRIHTGVTIGTQPGFSDKSPVIGDNCYLGPGAKIFGNIIIGSGTVVGANAVVNRNFPEGNQTIAGVPAKRISNRNSDGLIYKGYASQ